MMKRVLELKNKRAKAVADARAMLEAAQVEGKDLDAEQEERWDKFMAEADRLQKQIEREERMGAIDVEIGEEDEEEDGLPLNRRDVRGADEQRGEGTAEQVAFRAYLTRGLLGMRPQERRALQVDQDTKGGFLAHKAFIADLIKDVDNEVFIRSLATIYQVADATSLGAPKLTADPDDAEWTAEIGTGSEDSTMAFGERELTPHAIAKRIKMSRTLLRKVPNAEALVRGRLAYKFGVTMEKAYLTGNGQGKPLGLFTASAQGISTSRDVATANTATAITGDGLINAKFSLKGQHQANSAWLFHRDAVAQITKLKDGDGQYLWLASLRDGEPDSLLGRPMYMSEYVPNTFTSALYVGMIGNFSYYWIADSLMFELQRLDELYAETNQVGMIGRWESDGMPVLEEAFARVKLG